MKNLPLFMQIWLVMMLIMIGVSAVFAVFLSWTFQDFFTGEIYATIESSQDTLVNRFASEPTRENLEMTFFSGQSSQLQDIRTVNHVFLTDENRDEIAAYFPAEFVAKIAQEAREQTQNRQQYSGQIGDREIYYVITKVNLREPGGYLVSFMWNTYRQTLIDSLFERSAILLTGVFLLSGLPSFALAKYLSNPLVSLERRVKKLASRDWNKPVTLNRQDEIGRLGQTIEYLRQQLIKQDEAQQSFLQHSSHELKTPVMVIRSYIQSIRDGIYPKGDLESSVGVIEEEAERLEKRIRNLLYLTKLDYIATHQPRFETFDLTKIIGDVAGGMRWYRSDLDWSLNLASITLKGDAEQWRVALENLIDNQIRYARQQVAITLSDEGNRRVVQLHVWNDGLPIEEHVMESLFKKFSIGYRGEFGLGLAVVQSVASLHNAKIRVENEKGGVSFYIEIPSSLVADEHGTNI